MKNKDFIINNNELLNYLGNDKIVVIPEGVTSISSDAFISSECYSIVIPSTVSKVWKDAFAWCDNLVEIYNLSNVELNDDCFLFDESKPKPIVIHKSLYEPSALTFVDDFVFVKVDNEYILISYNGNERKVILPDNINGCSYSLGDNIFKKLNVNTLVIPKSVKHIPECLFNDMTRLYEIYNLSNCYLDYLGKSFYPSRVIHKDMSIESIIKKTDEGFLYIEKDEIYLIDFIGDNKDIVIPSTINNKKCNIAQNSFYSNNLIERVIISEGITHINVDAFSYCENLMSLTLPTTLEYIGDDSFYACDRLFEVNNLSNLDLNIEDSNLKNARIINDTFNKDSIFKYKDYLVGIANNEYYLLDYLGNEINLTLPDNINGHMYELFHTFNTNTTIKSINFGNGITKLDYDCMPYKSSLKQIFIPKNITNIKNGILFNSIESVIVEPTNPVYDSRDNCNAIIHTESNTLIAACNKTVIPSTVKIIGAHSFEALDIEKLLIPEGIEYIESLAFFLCNRLKEIKLPSTLTGEIEEDTFYTCPLYNVYYGGTREAWIEFTDYVYSSELLTSNIYFYHPVVNTPILLHRYNDAHDSNYIKGYITDIISNITVPSKDDNTLYDIKGTIKDIEFYPNNIIDITTIRMKFNDDKSTVLLELYVLDDIVQFYKENLTKNTKIGLTGRIVWEGPTYPIQFLHEEIEICNM